MASSPRRISLATVVVSCLVMLLIESSALRSLWADNVDGGPLLIHVLDPISKQMVLPDTFPLPGERTSSVILRACRGEFEPASVVLRAQNLDMTRVILTATDLRSVNSNAFIPSKHVDLKIVKPWFQSYYGWNEIGKSKPEDFRQRLFPELLLNDDALVHVDVGEEKNYVRLGSDRGATYVWVNPKKLASPRQALYTAQDFPIKDAKTLQPFDLPRNTSKQLWITAFVPQGTPSGMYSGEIEIRSSGVLQGKITLNLTVYPFELVESKITHSIYYRAVLNEEKAVISSEYRTAAQMQEDLHDLLNHGVTNPTLYQPLSNPKHLSEALSLRQALGMNGGPLYYLGSQTTATFLGSHAARAETNLKNILSKITTTAQQYGYSSVYIYGKDEAQGADLSAQRRLWDVAHSLKTKVFVAGYGDAFGLVGNSLDLLVHAKQPSESEAQKWHEQGQKIFNYGNPQAGPENPFLFRLNYGLVLWANGYDGAMPYAYQHCFGSCWNDVDHSAYRDHNLTYPTADGVVDTLAWEGFREGVDDVRYVSTLEYLVNHAPASAPTTDQAKNFLKELKDMILAKQANAGKYNQKMDIDLQAIRNQVVLLIDTLNKVS